MVDPGLYMVQIELDRARLFEFARRRRLPLRDLDLGYLLHCATRSVFGEYAPHPFSFEDRGRDLTMLGYTSHPSERLAEHGRAFSEPMDWAILRDLASKPMPQSFPSLVRLGFEARICPIVRKASAGPKHAKGAEVDVFLSRCWEQREPAALDRESVYREWLRCRLEQSTAATLVSASLVGFRRERVLRSTHGRVGSRFRMCERPDARVRGILEVGDPLSFQELLRRGIGRHRAFGFGMLLLRPAC